jgi:CRP-like cAMP-binding protein
MPSSHATVVPMAEFSKADHRANRLLAAMEPEDFTRLEPHLEIVDLPRGKVLYESGETIQHAYFPHDCVVSLVAVMEDGATAEMAVFGCEGVFGLISASFSLESLGRYIVHVPGTVSRVEVEQLQTALNASATLRELIRRYLAALFTQVLHSVACNAVHGVEARCCRWILSTHDRVHRDTLPLTHETLAEMLGVQRSTVSIITRTLQTAGLITQSRGGIMVMDRARLEEAACECYGTIRRNFDRLLPKTHSRD